MPTKLLKLSNGQQIYVEYDEAEIELNPQRIEIFAGSPDDEFDDLPAGAEHTGFMDDVIVSSKLLQETISGAAQDVYDALKDLQPDEWSVEMNVGFKGKAAIVPVLLTGEGSGGLKITAKWKKKPDE